MPGEGRRVRFHTLVCFHKQQKLQNASDDLRLETCRRRGTRQNASSLAVNIQRHRGNFKAAPPGCDAFKQAATRGDRGSQGGGHLVSFR